MNDSSAVRIWRCADCGHAVFPLRLACPACGADAFDPLAVREGRVMASTRQRDGTIIVTVQVTGGVMVVARAAGAAATPGDSVWLEDRGAAHPVPWALPVAPDERD